MEHLSHSHHPTKLSKRSAHANAATKGIYDDVFGGPPKFGVPTLSPRIEDYSEIFGGFHAPRISSIPVLDLPAVDDQEAFFDPRNPAFDYAEVFGDFNGLDFADGFEELVADQQRSGSICGSSEEAWTPAASESLSDETDHSGSNQCPSNGDSHHSYDGNIEYTISYHKTNPSSDSDMSNGLRHASQMLAVPVFSYTVDQTNSSEATENVHQFYQRGSGDDGCLDVGYNQKMVKEKHLKKTRSDTLNGSISSQGFSDDVGKRREYDRVGSCPDKGFVTISELNLRTVPSHLPPPSRPPPVLDTKMDYSSGSGSSKKSASLEGTEGDSSPSFFDVEADASSSAAAAASSAAMKETVAKARAQLRNAKELMERKQDGFQSRAKMTSNSDLQEARRKHCVDEITKGSCQRDSNGVKIPLLEEKQNLANAGQTNPAKTQGKELSLPKVAVGLEDAGVWKEATQIFELVKTKVANSEMDTEKQSSESSNNHDNGLEEVKLSEELYRRHENFKQKAVKEAQIVDVKEPREYQEAEYGKPREPQEANIQEDQEKKDKVSQVVCEQEEVHKKLNAFWHGETLNKLNNSVDSYNRERLNDDQIDVCEFEVRQLMGVKKHYPNLTESSEKMTDEGSFWKRHGGKGTINRETVVSEMEEERGIFITVLGKSEKEKGQQKLSEQDQTERRHKLIQKSVGETATITETNVPEVTNAKEDNDGRTLNMISEQEQREGITETRDREEHEWRLDFDLDLAEEPKGQEASVREETEKRLQEGLVREEAEQRLKQVHTQEHRKKLSEENERQETGKRETEAFQLGDLKRKEEASDHEEKKRRQWQALEKEEKEKVLKEVRKLEEKEKRQHKAYVGQEDKNRLQEAWWLEERVREAYEREGTGKVPKTLQQTKENEKNIKEDSEIDFYHRQVEASATHEVKANYGQEYEQEIDDALKETFELEQIDFELSEGTYFGESGVFGEDHKKDECKQNNIVGLQSDDLTAEIPRKQLETIGAFIDEDNGMSRNQSHGGGSGEPAVDEKTIDGRTGLIVSAGEVLENRKEGCGIGDSIKPLTANGLEAAPATGIVIEGTKCQKSSESEHQQGKASVDQGDKEKSIRQVEVCINEETKEDNFASSQSIDGESKKRNRMDLLQSAACNTQRTFQNASETESRKESVNRTVTPEEKDAERVRKDQELEKDRLRKIEEEREREREREKDRMAVDRAILEAQERAFSEARERPERAAVERAAAGARQRSLIEARERLEKLCAEAKERSLPDKDAKTRAERAVVERAMAEARQRAAEKTAYEGRERVDRSFSDNFSAPRYNGMRQSSLPSDLQNSQDQAVGSSVTSRQQYSSGFVASSSMEKPEGDEGESAQRCRARLERHRRTAERAAKALAEKNMRDLLAQREQAERNRLAETLDSEVKRWSSGKEGNLRALLSTLQYILGPGSGWQPIPLTEVITSVAVKKAYRKATLCVHPDKLQQRGASIQQKYICEKVFDLLKEAWSKFNNEER